MRKHLFWVVLLTVLTGCVSDNTVSNQPVSTELSGVVSGTLDVGASPYEVTDTITVEANSTLRIPAGVRLKFAPETMLIVKGTLESSGAGGRPVLFQPTGAGWLGIKFVDSQSSTISFSIIEGVRLSQPDTLRNCAIEVIRSELELSNTVIQDNISAVGGGLYALQANVNIRNNLFRGNRSENFGAGLFCTSSEARIVNNTIFDNNCINFGGGLVLANQVLSSVQNNIFFENKATTGDPRIAVFSGSSDNFVRQFNFLPTGGADPLFFSFDDLHLRENSPAVDAGNPDLAFNDFDASRNDQGAYGGPGGNW